MTTAKSSAGAGAPTPEASGEPLTCATCRHWDVEAGECLNGDSPVYRLRVAPDREPWADEWACVLHSASLPAAQGADVAALLDRLHELETTCILESENATDQGQMRAWHERAECAFRARAALDARLSPPQAGEP